MTNEVLESKIVELKLLQARQKELEAMIDMVKNSIKAELDERKVDSLDTGIHRIFYDCYEKKVVDTSKLKAHGLYDAYSKAQTIITLKITDISK